MANKEASLLLRIKTAGQDALDKVVFTFGDLIGLAKSVANALAAPVMAFREEEKAVNALTQAMVNSGVFTKQLRDDYLAQAAALQKLTTFADDQVIAAQAALQGMIGEQKITKELTMAVADLATAKGIDLVSAAEMVGKTIGSSTNALAKQGIEVDSNASKQEKLAQVIDGINGKWKGQAVAAAQGLGSLEQLKNVISDISENLGADLAPTVGVIVKALKGFAGDASNTEQSMRGLVRVVEFMVRLGVRLAAVFALVGDIIGITMAAQIENLKIQFGAVGQLVTALVTRDFGAIPGIIKKQFMDTKDNAVQAFDQLKTQAVDRIGSMYNTLDELDNAHAAKKEERRQKDIQDEGTAADNKNALANEKHAEQRQLELERKLMEDEENLSLQGVTDEQKLAQEIGFIEKRIANETNGKTKLALMEERMNMLRKQKQMGYEAAMTEYAKQQAVIREQNLSSTLSTIAGMQNSSNSLLAGIGKAAALTQIAIQTPVAIANALASPIPYPLNLVAAAAVGMAMAAQAAQVSGIKLAEGGIVLPRPGGTQATIGEAGQAEAVIPLDRMGEFGMGGGGGMTINLVVNGGLLGDEASAYQLAKAIDENLYKLRRNNESVAFERVT